VINLDKFIVIAEIQGLKVPNAMYIQKPDKKIFYLFPGDFADKLKRYNKMISSIKRKSKKLNEISDEQYYSVEPDQNSSTFILSEFKLDPLLDKRDLFQIIRKHFLPLMLIFSFFFMRILYIKRVFIFQKTSIFFKFIRLIEKPIEKIEAMKSSPIFIDRRQGVLESLIPLLLVKLCGKEKFFPTIEEYLNGKLRTNYIEIEFITFWNVLEHLAEIYWEGLGKNKLLTIEKYSELKELVINFSNSINQNDILFPNVDTTRAKELIKTKVNNYPAIKDEIIHMCRKIKFNLTQDQRNLIEKMYFLRINLYHKGKHLNDLVDEYKIKFNEPDYTLYNIGYDIHLFDVLIQQIILQLFKFTLKYIKFGSSKGVYLRLFSRRIKYDKSYLEKLNGMHEIPIKLDEIYNTEEFLGLKVLIEMKNQLMGKSNYYSLLKFLGLRFIPRIKKFKNKKYFQGRIKNSQGELPIEVKFSENLKGDFHINVQNNQRKLWNTMRSPIFKSEIKNEYKGFYIEFKFLLTLATHTWNKGDFRDLKTEYNGNFISLLIDIKKK